MAHRSIQLLELVNSLSNPEKKFFRNFNASIDKPTEGIKLFELYCKHGDKNEDLILSFALKFCSPKNLNTEKEKLFHSICEAMCFYHKDEMKVLNAYTQLQKIYFLISKGLSGEAGKQVVQLRNKLLHSQQRSLIPLLYGIESYLYFDQEENESFFATLEKHEQSIQPLSEFKEMLDTRNYLYATNTLTRKGHRLTNKAKKSGSNFIHNYQLQYNKNTKFVSPLSELNHLNGVASDLRLDRAYRLKAAIDQYQLIKKNPGTFSIETTLMSVYNIVYLSYYNSDMKTGNAHFNELEKIKPLTLAQKTYKFESILASKLIINSFQTKYSEINFLLEEFDKQKKKLRLKYSESVLAFLYHFKIFTNILLSEASENKKMILRFSTSEIKRTQPALFEAYRILEILNAIELNDLDFVVYLIRNAKLSFRKDPHLMELLYILELIQKSIESNVFSKKEIILKRLEELYDPLYRNDSSHLIFHYFKLDEWAAKKLKS